MDGKIFVLLIVGLVFLFAFVERWQKHQISIKKQQATAGDEEMRAALDDLKGRVETLERLATDKGARLREEIDAL